MLSKGLPGTFRLIRQRLTFHCTAIQSAKSKVQAPIQGFRARASFDHEDSEAEIAAKAESLKNVMAALNKKHGSNSVLPASEFRHSDGEVLKTGVMTLDILLGGGWPVGRLIEIYGPESSGKTTLCLTAIRELQRDPNKSAVLIDAEHALDLRFCKKIGIDTSRLIVTKPDFGEQAMDMMLSLINSGGVNLIVLDSVASLVPKADVEGEMGQPTMGSHARLMSSSLKKIANAAENQKCTVLFTNQIRLKIGVMFGNPETTTGGKALLFYSSVRVDLRKTKKIPGSKKGDEDQGVKVRAKIVKSKISAPFRETEFDILWASGIDQVGCIFDAGLKLGVITARGSHYYHGEEKLGQGREKVLEILKADDAKREELENLIHQAITDETDGSVLLQTDGMDPDFDEEGKPVDGALGSDEELYLSDDETKAA